FANQAVLRCCSRSTEHDVVRHATLGSFAILILRPCNGRTLGNLLLRNKNRCGRLFRSRIRTRLVYWQWWHVSACSLHGAYWLRSHQHHGGWFRLPRGRVGNHLMLRVFDPRTVVPRECSIPWRAEEGSRFKGRNGWRQLP